MKIFINRHLDVLENEKKNIIKEIKFRNLPEFVKEDISEDESIAEIKRIYQTESGYVIEFESEFYDDVCEGSVFYKKDASLTVWDVATTI